MLRASLVVGLAAALAPATFGQHRDVLRRPLVGQVPPELDDVGAEWFHGPPVTLAGLRGHVVWLQFNF